MPDDYFAHPLKNSSIVELASVWREALGIERTVHFVDILQILEITLPQVFPPFSLVIEADSGDDIEGYTEFDPPTIVIRESVYLAASRREGRARWTMAHELGHLMLHDSAVPMARAPAAYQRMKNLPAYASTEKQAEKFAAAFLMPDWVVRRYNTAASLSQACGVSFRAASIQLEKAERKGRLFVPRIF